MHRNEDVLLGIDAGTSSTKVAACDQAGNVIAFEERKYSSSCPAPGWVEQDPLDWWEAVIQCFLSLWKRGMSPKKVLGVGLSGQMQLCLPLDRAGHPLYPAMLYADRRAVQESNLINQQFGEQSIRQLTGNSLDSATTTAKLLWLKKNHPELYRKTRVVLSGAKDYLLFRLTGVYATDPTNGSTTGMMDIRKRQWSRAFLREIGLSPELMPSIVPASERVGPVTERAARETGLTAGCPVFCGAGDAGTSSLGSGVIRQGRAHCYLGTTGWVATVDTQPPEKSPEGLFTLCDPDPNHYLLIAPLLNAGRVYQWAGTVFGEWEKQQAEEQGKTLYAVFEKKIQEVPAGSRGVVFLPYLRGERSPFQDPNARGVFFGLTEETTRFDMIRATLEGVSFGIRQVLATIRREEAGKTIEKLVLIGGGSQSRVWSQMLADVCQCPIVVPEHSALIPCLGAIIPAFVGLGQATDYSIVDRFLKEQRIHQPASTTMKAYDRVFSVYQQLYPLLKPAFQFSQEKPAMEEEKYGRRGEE